MGKKKCPSCGAKNSKERVTCMECGAPLTSEAVDERTTEVPQKDKPNLASTMKRPDSRRKNGWLWAGLILLSISVLWWLIFIIAIVSEPKDVVVSFVVWLLLSALPIGIGIYGVWRGRKEPVAKIQKADRATYVTGQDRKLAYEATRNFEPIYSTEAKGNPVQGTMTGIFRRLKKKLRDNTRDRLCAGLGAMRVNAEMLERGRAEEKIGGKGSLGLIGIAEGPIRWINVRKETYNAGQYGSNVYYYTEYGVPDPKLTPNSSKLKISTVRVKTFPVVGRVVDLHWKGNDFGLGKIQRLKGDASIKQPIMESRDVTIRAHSDHRCWIISTQTRDAPSRELWDCYQKITKHLLAEWSLSV